MIAILPTVAQAAKLSKMPLVAEVLASIKQRTGVEGGSAGGDGVCVEVAELAKRAQEAKVAVIQALEDQYVQLYSTLQDMTILQTRVNGNLSQLQLLESSLSTDVQPSVAQSVSAVSSVATRWQQAVQGLQVAQQLLEVHEVLRRAGDDGAAGKYYFAAKGLNKVEELLSTIDTGVEVLPGIIEEVVVQRNNLIHGLSQVWRQAFRWEEELHQQKKRKTLTLFIRCCQSSTAEGDTSTITDSKGAGELMRDFSQVLAALNMLGELHMRVAVLADNIMDNFLRVAVGRSATVARQRCGDADAISITFATSDSSRHSCPPPPPACVFDTIERLLRLLHETGFGLMFETGEGEQSSLMELLGEEIGAPFTSLLISDCLAAAVPCSRKDLDKFDAVKTETQTFHAMLLSIGFYNGSESSILSYAADVDAVFSNKACAHLLDTARRLIAQPLHNTVTIASQDGYPPLAVQDLLPEDENGVRLEKSTLRLENLLAAKTFHMPNCQVSKSICELVDLLYETLEEACSSSPQYAGRLLCTVRNMLTLYEHVTPVAHAATLGTIPQHAALVHNNSMFVSSHCYLLAHQFRSRLPAELRDCGAACYTDLSYQITKAGTEVFCQAMQGHKKALLDTIGQSQGFGEVPSDAGVRQCLHQLQQLRNVWHLVLPHSVYNKAMGTLLNSVVKELIERVLALEDISEDSAVTLVASLAVLKEHGASLFPGTSTTPTTTAPPASSREGLSGVSQWGRFLELMLVLGASLRELQDRWADGKGPLALYFTPDQAKALVRALFQNTDRRAKLLSTIKLQ